MSRRELLVRAGAAGLAAAWSPTFRLDPASAGAGCAPPGFPSGVELYKQGFENWSREVAVDDLWTCAPSTPRDVVRLANWARRNAWRLRPRGGMHSWPPLTITNSGDCAEQAVLVDLTRHFNSIEVLDGGRVRVGAGATMGALLITLEEHGLGITGVPSTGEITLGGALAMGAHGASVPALGEQRLDGHTYGSLSNLILSLEALVWDARKGRYVLRTFNRSHPDCKVFLAHLGRAFITTATLRVGANVRLRCESRTDIPASELFAAPGPPGPRRFSDFLDASGRLETIWFPFTENPWLKVWSVADQKPEGAREVTAPYNYPFSDALPDEVIRLADKVVKGVDLVTPLFGRIMYGAVAAGLPATQSQDIWGWSRTTQLYIKASTLRVAELGLAIVTSRANVQTVLSDFAAYWQRRLEQLASEGSYPMNMPLEMRVSGLDRPSHARRRRAQAPALASTRPRWDRKDWDVVVWINPLTFPGTRASWRFYAELEQFSRRRFSGGDALWRPEWTKGWAYTDAGPWTDASAIRESMPGPWRTGYRDRGWDWAMRRLRHYDPYELFTNSFTRELFAPRGR